MEGRLQLAPQGDRAARGAHSHLQAVVWQRQEARVHRSSGRAIADESPGGSSCCFGAVRLGRVAQRDHVCAGCCRQALQHRRRWQGGPGVLWVAAVLLLRHVLQQPLIAGLPLLRCALATCCCPRGCLRGAKLLLAASSKQLQRRPVCALSGVVLVVRLADWRTVARAPQVLLLLLPAHVAHTHLLPHKLQPLRGL